MLCGSLYYIMFLNCITENVQVKEDRMLVSPAVSYRSRLAEPMTSVPKVARLTN
jgi:hypothetical protein